MAIGKENLAHAPRLPIIFGIAVLIGALGLPNFAGSFESVLVGVLEVPLLIVGACLAVRATLRASQDTVRSSTVLLISIGLVSLTLLGQIAKSKKPFPFMPLRMYGSEAESHEQFLFYEARLSDGTQFRLRPALIVAELGSARAARGLERRLKGLPATGNFLDEGQLSKVQKQGVDMLRFLMRKKNEQLQEEGNDSLVTDILVYNIDLQAPYSSSHQTRSFLYRVALKSR